MSKLKPGGFPRVKGQPRLGVPFTGISKFVAIGLNHAAYPQALSLWLDVICTGTPPGVEQGMKPPQVLKAGEVMTLGIAGLGEQRQVVGRYLTIKRTGLPGCGVTPTRTSKPDVSSAGA